MDKINEERTFAPIITSPDGIAGGYGDAEGGNKTGGSLTVAPGRLTPMGQGRIKEAPLCLAPSLKRVASSNSDLMMDGLCFSPEEAAACLAKSSSFARSSVIETCENNGIDQQGASRAADGNSKHASSNSTIITCSTTSSCVNGWLDGGAAKDPPLDVVSTEKLVAEDELPPQSEDESGTGTDRVDHPLPRSPPSSFSPLKNPSTARLIREKSSRQGRSRQRWLVHEKTDELVRQVAGCIPITRDGRVLLCSASRKLEWILPKGGWDTDETSEECAIRESFEEAGVMGTLGPRLKPIDYETRKAKKRRLEKANSVSSSTSGEEKSGEDLKIGSKDTSDNHQYAGKKAKTSNSSSDLQLSPWKEMPTQTKNLEGSNPATPVASNSRGKEECPLSNASAPNPEKYSFVRIFLYPLYISEVKEEWPEKGRLRKLASIDEAIRIMEGQKRFEFRAALLQVKEMGLHRLNPSVSAADFSTESIKSVQMHLFAKESR